MDQVMEILKRIGFDQYNAVISIVNFFLAYAILSKYLFPKIQEKLEERKKKIEQIEKKEKVLEKYIAEKHSEAEKIVEEAHLKADRILSNAITEAEKSKKAVLREATDRVLALEMKHKTELHKQKVQMIKDARTEVINLSAKISEKILGPRITDEVNEKLIEDLLVQVEKDLNN